ncbi:hypothetical protein OROMI_018555 [Orobanche minor]
MKNVPQDEEISHPTAAPTIDAPASPCSQPDDEFLLEDRPMRPTHHTALKLLTGPEDKLGRLDLPRYERTKERLGALGRQNVFV